MAKVDSTKIRIIAVYRLLANSKRRLSCNDIIRHLERTFGIEADRRTIMSDIRSIDRFIPIISFEGRYGGYEVYSTGCADDA